MQADTKVLPRIAKSKRNLKGIVIENKQKWSRNYNVENEIIVETYQFSRSKSVFKTRKK